MILTILRRWKRWVVVHYNKWKANEEIKALERQAALERERDNENKIQRTEEAFRTGAEIEPPWALWPYAMSWNQGWGELYYKDMWWPYIERLTREERIDYLEKWPIPEHAEWQQWPDRVLRPPYGSRETE